MLDLHPLSVAVDREITPSRTTGQTRKNRNMIKLTTTRSASKQRLKVLVHAPAGSGKTVLCSTTGDHKRTVIISAESGLLSLGRVNIPVIEINTIQDLYEAYEFLTVGDGAGMFDWICIDSISEIAEKVLLDEKRKNKDPRAAYGNLQDEMNRLLRAFRDLDVNVYMSAKQGSVKDEISGITMRGPSFPGSKLAEAVPYLFDEVFALRVHTEYDDDGNVSKVERMLQTGTDGSYSAKDRSSALDLFEPPSLGDIAAKIDAYVNDGQSEEIPEAVEIKSSQDLIKEAEEAAVAADSTPDPVEGDDEEANENGDFSED